MASAPLLNFDSLTAPIPGDNPAGDAVPFEVRDKLEKSRIEINPNDLDPDDPTRSEIKPQKADWAGIVRLAQETLQEKSKDLLVGARLTEALVKEHGFAGLRDGLHLLRKLVQDCWDRVNPSIEDGDLEARVGPFSWLDDASRGARFPNTVRAVPLVSADGQRLGWIDWKQSLNGHGTVTQADFQRAIDSTPAATIEGINADLQSAGEELKQLVEALKGKMADTAPGMTGLSQAVEECQTLVRQIAGMKPQEGGEAPEGQSTTGGPATAGTPRAAGSRAEIYRQLEQSATVLRQLEPHSPIPYLILRAVELGRLPFPDLIRALIREPNVLSELSREFGLKEPEPPAAG